MGLSASLGVGTTSPEDVFHVDDYGAVADSDGTTGNGTDNYTSITNCVTACIANGGGIIRFGFGIYRTTENILIENGSNIIIEGSGGRGSSTLFHDNTTITTGGHLYLRECNNIILRNFKVLGRRTFTTANHGIKLQGIVNGLVTNCEVEGANCFGIYVTGYTANTQFVEIIGNRIHKTAADGIHVSNKVADIKIVDNTIHETADDAIGIGYEGVAPVTRILVSSNTIFNTGARGIAVLGHSTSIRVEDNSVANTWLAGLYCECNTGAVARISFVDNHLNGAGTYTPTAEINARGTGISCGVQLNPTANTMSYIEIRGNTITSVYNGFMYLGFATGSVVNKIDFLTVKDNVCYGIVNVGGRGAALGTMGGSSSDPAVYPGILCRNAQNIDIAGNTIVFNNQEAILCESTVAGLINLLNNKTLYPNQSGSAGRYAYKIAGGSLSAISNIAKLNGASLTGTLDTTGATLIQTSLNPAPAV